MDYLGIFLGFCGGLGLFIYGMHIMASGLQKAAGGKMKRLLELLTSNKLLAILIGTLVTAIIQSSSATTVMVVGFVNAGLMDLTQSVGVIMGANIGTTVTAWLVALLEMGSGGNGSSILTLFNPTTIAPIATVAGAFMLLMVKKKSVKQTGEIIAGLGILFLGMVSMSSSLKPLSSSPFFKELFVTLGSNPLLGVLTGVVVTGVIQSSSASVGILQSLAMAGLIPWDAAVYIIMGQNIGTCVTALLSSIGATRNAKAAAYIHLLFNVVGSVIFSILAVVFFRFINPTLGEAMITATYIGIVHTSFNIANTVFLYPFGNLLIAGAQKMANTKGATHDESALVHLDDRVLETPTFAVESCKKEIERLALLAYENLDMATQSLVEKDMDKVERVFEREGNIDSLCRAITTYMVKICNLNINEQENDYVTALFHTVNDIERIGDHSENIAELAVYHIEENAAFSEIALEHINDIIAVTKKCFETSITCLANDDVRLAAKVFQLEEEVDNLEKLYRAGHIDRLTSGECNASTGVVYLDTLTNLERISDHAKNIAQFVTKRKHLK